MLKGKWSLTMSLLEIILCILLTGGVIAYGIVLFIKRKKKPKNENKDEEE